MRFKSPIFAEEAVLSEAAFMPDEEDEPTAGPSRTGEDDRPPAPKTWSEDLASMSTDELEAILEDALKEEDYYKAAGIRDEINRRKK